MLFIITGRLPRAIYVFFLENSQIVGTINKNPFVFKNYDVSESHISISGFPYPSEPIRTNFTPNQMDVMPAFRWFLDNVGKTNLTLSLYSTFKFIRNFKKGISDNDCDIGVTASEYASNLFMIPFDLSPRGVRFFQKKVFKNHILYFYFTK